jgi:hypothetical protein
VRGRAQSRLQPRSSDPLAREGDDMIGAGSDRAILSGLGDMDRSDMKSFAAEQVGQTQTKHARRASDAHHLRKVVSL